MTVTRGFTEEADKLLDYLENGIFDALQKQYLRSFVFAIYLDDQDPNNIIEAYTFNFSYCKVPGSEGTVPVMSLGEDMMNLSLSGTNKPLDPVADATRRGKIPTLGEVKRSLKALVKNLIQATTQMDALPKRRFATFKLFYYENTPDDYEPPHFRAGDAKRHKWFMSTHDKGEVPERCSVGSVQTGYHGVEVKVTSVSGYLPSGEDNSAPFLGTTSANPFGAPPLTPVEEAAMRAEQIHIQRQDASERRVVWDADDGVLAASGGFSDDESNRKDADKKQILAPTAPIGIRDDEGNIVPLSQDSSEYEKAEAQYSGKPESVPACIGQLTKVPLQAGHELSPTQEIEDTQVIPSPQTSPMPSQSASRSVTPTPRQKSRRDGTPAGGSSLPPSDIDPLSSGHGKTPEGIDSQDVVMDGTSALQEDSMILDLETQRVPQNPRADESIESFGQSRPGLTLRDSDITMEQDKSNITSVECECGVQIEDCDCCKCDGGCERWFHLWCMGYHSAQDHRIPSKFICFDCRVKADRNWDLIVIHDLYPRMIAKFKDLAIQRRGIKIFETHAPDSLSAFTKLIGCEPTVAGQVFKRLDAEGFIAQEICEADESGFMETKSLATKRKPKGKGGAKGKVAQRRKKLQKAIYVFVQAIKNEEAYKDYFNPDPEVEKRLLGLSDLTSHLESQTQHKGQHPGPDDLQGDLKRKASGGSEDAANARKKIKISLGPAVDLGD
ncbi:HORMA domain-containing protein [Cubamyces lactineus]|nr:HORMA domain-containing protein [Cubamyces lactineus]